MAIIFLIYFNSTISEWILASLPPTDLVFIMEQLRVILVENIAVRFLLPLALIHSTSTSLQGSVVHSHWSRNVEARLSLVESFIVMLRQLSYAIKNQLGHPKPPTRGFGTQRHNGSLLAPRWFFMA